MFNDYSKMNLLAVVETRFAFWIIMLKRFKVIKRNLQDFGESSKETFNIWFLVIDGTCTGMMM